MAKTPIKRSELLANGGYAVVNTRAANTGFVPLVFKAGFPADLDTRLREEEAANGYPQAYIDASKYQRNRRWDVWVSDNGVSIGDLGPQHYLPAVDQEIERWATDPAFVAQSIGQMRLPLLGELPSIKWSGQYDSGGAKPGQSIFDLAQYDATIARRVGTVLLGYVPSPSQIKQARVYARVAGDPSPWPVQTGAPGSDMMLATMPATDDSTITFVLFQNWAEIAFVFTFGDLPKPPLVRYMAFNFDIYNWQGAQVIYNATWQCAKTPVSDRLTGKNLIAMRAPLYTMLESHGSYSETLPPESYSFGSDPYDPKVGFRVPYRSTFYGSWMSDNAKPVRMVFMDEVTTDDLTDYGSLRHGRMFVYGMNPLFQGAHLQGPTTVNSAVGEIRVEQRKIGYTWRGRDLIPIMMDATEEQKVQLRKMTALSVINLTGVWTTPLDPVKQLNLYRQAEEAEFDLMSETFAEATTNNPAVTFKQANDRASLKQTNIVHRIATINEHPVISFVKISGVPGAYIATAYRYDGTVVLDVDVNDMALALKRGATVSFSLGEGGDSESAMLVVFGFAQADLAAETSALSPTSTIGGELDEAMMFRGQLPSLDTDVPLNARAAFSLLQFTPSRSSINEVVFGGMAMSEYLRKRLTA